MLNHNKKHTFIFIIGVFTGIIVLCALRVQYYDFMGYRPNMHPGIAFFFLPIIFPIILFVSLFLESILWRFGYKTYTKLQVFIVGFLHVSIVWWWAFPDHAFIFILINPIVLRLIIDKFFKMNSAEKNKGGTP